MYNNKQKQYSVQFAVINGVVMTEEEALEHDFA